MSLAWIDEYSGCDLTFTADERKRIREYQPPGDIEMAYYCRKRPGQTSQQAAEERRAWYQAWSADVARMVYFG